MNRDNYNNSISATSSYKSTGIETAQQSKLIQWEHNYFATCSTNSPRLFQKYLSLKQRYISKCKALKVRNQHISRLKKRIASLKDIVSILRKNKHVSENGLLCLDSLPDTDINQFLQRFTKNSKKTTISREKYPPTLRSFAMTLHFYSPKAYNFVREKFLSALPHSRTINWYSSLNGEPGFTFESFEILKHHAAQAKKQKKSSGFTSS